MNDSTIVRGAVLAAALGLAGPALAACDGMVVNGAWVRTPPPGASRAAAYFTVENRGRAAVRIVGVESPDFDGTMLHETRYVEGAARMRQVEIIDIEPGARFRAAPGGTHVMLMGAHDELDDGTVVHLRLLCAGGGALDLAATVAAQAPSGPAP